VRSRLLTPSIDWLLVFLPVAIGAEFLHMPALVFITSALAIVPLAGLIGRSTEQVAIRLGPAAGGLLNATMGNITELIVAVALVSVGNFALVKASLIGSIIGNLLLVTGISFVVGGVRHVEQQFSARAAGVHSSSLLLAVAGLVVPAVLVLSTPNVDFVAREVVSGVVAIVLIALYLAALFFTQVSHAHLFHTPDREEKAKWSLGSAMVVLIGSAALVGLASEFLVGSLEPAVATLHVPEIFVGLILIPVIGNAAEHGAAVIFAAKNRVDVTLEIAVGSSTQIAMFVAPVLVFISLAIGHPMDFVFTTFEVVIVLLGTLIMAVISMDGRSNWLEGAQLLGAYLLIAVAAFFIA
jgi:Ca2+:H+ antiporter